MGAAQRGGAVGDPAFALLGMGSTPIPDALPQDQSGRAPGPSLMGVGEGGAAPDKEEHPLLLGEAWFTGLVWGGGVPLERSPCKRTNRTPASHHTPAHPNTNQEQELSPGG